MANKLITLNFDGEPHDAMVVEEKGELVAHTKSGRFAKFPLEYDEGDSFAKAVKRHNDANAEVPAAPDAEAEASRSELAEWLGGTDTAE